ncbi:ThiF family adenylyltransferase [Brevibacillus daliensis]|uniref:ThiF family adenylyltransferase n=1 Tax=Brevibacillus daliensis TaxID=2892995 RepID=UPI001E3DCD6E|nr:ThiF family adenylyltransferase [Brevibacillus daliensis]
MRPKIKTILTPINRSGNVLRIGYEKSIFEVEDADGQILTFLQLIDGSHTIEEIVALSGMTEEEVWAALTELNENKLLEDLDAVTQLSEEEQERYRANLTYFSNFADLETSKYHFQQKLRDSKIVVLGLGGSSLVASCFAGMGVGSLVGVDYDIVEISNLNRQFLFSEQEIGMLKTEASKNRLYQVNKTMKVEVVNRLITGVSSLIDLLEDADLVINMIDQPAITATRWVNSACVHAGIPVIQGGVGNLEYFIQKFHPSKGCCYDCTLIQMLRTDPFMESQLRMLYNQTFERRNTAFAPIIAMLCGQLAQEAAKTILGFEEALQSGTVVTFNTMQATENRIKTWDAVPECPTCGANRDNSEWGEPVDIEVLFSFAREQTVQS